MVQKAMEVYKSFEEWREENDDGNQFIVYMFDDAQIDITGLDFCYPANMEAVRKMFLAHDVVFTESPAEFQAEIIALQKELRVDTYFMQERYQDLYIKERYEPVYNYIDRNLVEKTVSENFDVLVPYFVKGESFVIKPLISMFKYSDLMLMYLSILRVQGKVSNEELRIYGDLTEDLIFDYTREKLVPRIKQIQPEE
jgi:hypothetical protein